MGRLGRVATQLRDLTFSMSGVRETERGVRILKLKSSKHVGAMVGLTMALEALEPRPAKRNSVYEERGVELVEW